MEMTVFTLAMTVFWVSIFVKIISFLRKRMADMKYFSIYPLLLLLMLCILRVIFPLELPFTTIIRSKKLLPPVQIFLCTPFCNIFGFDIAVFHMILGIWGLGTGIILIKHAKAYLLFRHAVNIFPDTTNIHLYEILDKTYAGDLNGIKIKIHKSFQSPAIIGFIHPVIIMPDIELNDDQLFGIFLHEVSHYKLKHNMIKLISEIIQACFWWNPMFRTLSAEVAHALELHSDKMVYSRLDQRQLGEYLQGIIKVLRNVNGEENLAFCGCSFVEETDSDKLKQRFKMILINDYQSNNKTSFLMIPLILVVFLLSYSFVVQPYIESIPDDYGNTLEILDSNSYYFIESNNGYDLYDYSNKFVTTIENPQDECFKELKIYENMEDAKKP